jgi:tetratricopeptide (TPR) repeat protein
MSDDARLGQSPRNREWIFGVILFAAVVVVYLPVWRAGYLWDDDIVLTGNPCMAGIAGLKDIWTSGAADICPLTLSTFWIEHALWGFAPLPYHVVNVLLHGGGAIALWRVLRALRIPGAWLGAALWALHPVQVESVAWIAEMKNTESGLFYLLAILFFLRDLKTERGVNYGASLLFAAMAMASKSSTVVLPVVLVLCVWWMEGRVSRTRVLKIAPMFLFSLAAGLVSIWTQTQNAAGDISSPHSWPERFVIAGGAIWFYLGKLIWPHPLLVVYPQWKVEAGAWFSYLPLLCVFAILFGFWFWRGAWSRPWLFAWAYFLVALLPVLGLVHMNFQDQSFVADHFQYLASMGPLALLAAGGVGLGRKLELEWVPMVIGGAALGIVGCLSWARATVFQNEDALWSNTLATNPNTWVGQNNFGAVLVEKGDLEGAIRRFRKALELNPHYVIANNDLGIVLERVGKPEEARAEYEKAIRIEPSYGVSYDNLGHILFSEGKVDEAIAAYRKAVMLNPGDAEGINNLGNALFQKGDVDEAMGDFQKALKLAPDLGVAHTNLGNAFFRKGLYAQAIDEYKKSIKSAPNDAEVHNILGIALVQTGRLNEAIEQFQAAVNINPGYHDAVANLARAKASAAQNGGGP